MCRLAPFLRVVLPLVASAPALAQATVVPTEIQQPGTQPGEVALESVTRCDNCHSGFDPASEPYHLWAGGAMAHAGRDPLFWATVAVAEQDFLGAGDLCLRCHSPEGWMAGRSTPTDGSALRPEDADGVSCDVCHQLVNPDDSEHLGMQLAPFVANDGETPPLPYSGTGMYVMYAGSAKLGPYADSVARHSALPSSFHRSSALCGTCHDVSNPAVGDLAPGNGAPLPLAEGTYSGLLGAPVEQKAAFGNFPYAYGVVERTYSEHVASAFDDTRVSSYASLPPELKDGAVRAARDAAVAWVPSGDYADGEARFFTCQTCHMRPTLGKGASMHNAPLRGDLPRHDLTGGNTWIYDAIRYLDGQGRLLLGGGLSSVQRAAMDDGRARAAQNLAAAASLTVLGDTVRVVNLTGHKLPTGYPEGRRMWLRVRWFDAGGTLLREDGGYGPLEVQHEGEPLTVRSLLKPADPRLALWEVHAGLTQEWASRLVALGYDPALPLAYDRRTGEVEATLGALAAAPQGTPHESFHFVLNDTVLSDPRIPPWGMSYDEALQRNVRPVPETLFGGPGPGEVYRHWEDVELDPPLAATRATIELLYQATSWEYVQFLALASDEGTGFLAEAGEDLLEAWLATGMSPPVLMASATWRTTSPVRKVRGAPEPLPAPRASAPVEATATAEAPTDGRWRTALAPSAGRGSGPERRARHRWGLRARS